MLKNKVNIDYIIKTNYTIIAYLLRGREEVNSLKQWIKLLALYLIYLIVEHFDD